MAFRSLCTVGSSFGIRGATYPALLAGTRRLWLVRHSNLDRWLRRFTRSATFSFLLGKLPIFADRVSALCGINAAQLGCFFFFWLINMFVIYMGIESIRILLNIKAPLLDCCSVCRCLAWAYFAAGGFGDMLSQPSQFDAGPTAKTGKFWSYFLLALTGNVGLLGDARA